MTEQINLSELSEQELRENYIFDDLVKMNKDLQQKLENAKNENKYREKRIAELSIKRETLQSTVDELTQANQDLCTKITELESKLQTPKDIDIDDCLLFNYQSAHLFTLQSAIDKEKRNNAKLESKNASLNATIDVLLERLKGKSE